MIEDYFVDGIEIERYVEGTDELGNPLKIWENHLTIKGLIDALTGDEQSKANAPAVVSSHMLFCHVVDISEKDRVKFQGKTYNITFVDNPMSFNRFLQVSLELI